MSSVAVIAVSATTGGLAYLAVGAALARWNFGYFRAKALDKFVGSWRNPGDHWHGSDEQFGAVVTSLLAFLAPPAWVLVVGVSLYIRSSGRKSTWEKEKELKDFRARTERLERENADLERELRAK